MARWVTEIQQFSFEVAHRPGEKLPDADALSRLPIPRDTLNGNINHARIRESTQHLELQDGKFHVPEFMIPRVLQLHHESSESERPDGF